MADLDDIRTRLEGIAEELTEHAIELLREAVEAGADKRPEMEKRVTRARAGIEKAARLLAE
ncbi:MAG: hypothetical protein ACR2LQ_05510 [Acidimicrobiales bacterium]